MPNFETPQPISVVLDLRKGDVRVTAGERGDTTVQVRPSDPASGEDVSAAEQTRVEYADGRLLIKGPAVKGPRRLRELTAFSNGARIAVEIELPVGSDLSALAAEGGFHCSGPLGRCELKSSFGDISLDQAADVKLTTFGDIRFDRVTGDAELSSAGGAVDVGAIDGSAAVRSSNGDTRIQSVGGDLAVKAANGRIDVEHTHGSVSAKTANGRIRIGSMHRGALVAETAAGRIDVGIADGVAAWLDLHAHHGQVRNELADADAPASGDERVEVRARTSYGDITIHRGSEHADEPVARRGSDHA